MISKINIFYILESNFFGMLNMGILLKLSLFFHWVLFIRNVLSVGFGRNLTISVKDGKDVVGDENVIVKEPEHEIVLVALEICPFHFC